MTGVTGSFLGHGLPVNESSATERREGYGMPHA